MSERTKIMLEVTDWAAHARDRGVRGPDLVMWGTELAIWKNAYMSAMNDVAQHFNTEYLASRTVDERAER